MDLTGRLIAHFSGRSAMMMRQLRGHSQASYRRADQ
jgi:hypothetical protein